MNVLCDYIFHFTGGVCVYGCEWHDDCNSYHKRNMTTELCYSLYQTSCVTSEDCGSSALYCNEDYVCSAVERLWSSCHMSSECGKQTP